MFTRQLRMQHSDDLIMVLQSDPNIDATLEAVEAVAEKYRGLLVFLRFRAEHVQFVIISINSAMMSNPIVEESVLFKIVFNALMFSVFKVIAPRRHYFGISRFLFFLHAMTLIVFAYILAKRLNRTFLSLLFSSLIFQVGTVFKTTYFNL